MGLTDLIYRYLLQDEQTRDSDTKLYMRICAHLNAVAIHMPFCDVIGNLKELGLPSIETVTRLRRKVQAEHPEVRASEQVTEWRADKEEQARAGIFV